MKALSVLAHELTPVQIEELAEYEIIKLSQLDPDLFKQLIQCPGDRYELENLADKLLEKIVHWQHGRPIYDKVILPVGSPAFQFIFAQKCVSYDLAEIVIFAHSVRDFVEKPSEKFVEDLDHPGNYIKVQTIEKTNIFNHVKFF